LISKKWSTQKVKSLVKNTKKLIWNLEYRPWWSYKIINEWIWFKTKRITILPWKKTSLQSHNHRSEHWVIAEWTAKVHKKDWSVLVAKWESVYVSIWELHRIENPWLIPLVIIETQIWDYLWEDDIIRYEDDYWRE
jgi:mannose-1-phosphate guanylyltransferase/mannose-6-phosphate isomerase